MKKLFIILVMSLLLYSKSNAQQIQWAKTYDFSSIWLYSFIQLNDSGFILTGDLWDSISTTLFTYAIRVDKYGDTVWTQRYNQNPGSGFVSIAAVSDSIFIGSGGFDFPGESVTSIGVININGDTLLHRTYGNPNNADNPGNINSCPDGGFIFSNDGFSVNDIIKLDSNYNIEFTRSSLMYQITMIKPDIGGGYVAVGRSGQFGTCYGLLRLDKFGNTISYNTYGNMGPNTNNQYAWDVVVMPDSNYLVATDGTDWQAMKIDRNTGDTLWTKNYMPYGFSGHFLYRLSYAGNDSYFCSFYTSYNGVMLINGTDGDTIWTRKGTYGISPFYIYDSKTTSDGGYAYCGLFGGTGSDSYLIKLDSLGNTVWTSVINHQKNQLASIYPNPAQTSFNISTTTFSPSEKLTVNIIDMQGRMMQQTNYTPNQPINISTLPPGMYAVEIRGKEKVVREKLIKE